MGILLMGLEENTQDLFRVSSDYFLNCNAELSQVVFAIISPKSVCGPDIEVVGCHFDDIAHFVVEEERLVLIVVFFGDEEGAVRVGVEPVGISSVLYFEGRLSIGHPSALFAPDGVLLFEHDDFDIVAVGSNDEV